MFRHSYVIFSCKCSTVLLLNFHCMHLDVIAELQRPDVSPRGAPCSYRKEKETDELIFLWSSRLRYCSWTCTQNADDRAAQDDGHT